MPPELIVIVLFVDVFEDTNDVPVKVPPAVILDADEIVPLNVPVEPLMSPLKYALPLELILKLGEVMVPFDTFIAVPETENAAPSAVVVSLGGPDEYTYPEDFIIPVVITAPDMDVTFPLT